MIWTIILLCNCPWVVVQSIKLVKSAFIGNQCTPGFCIRLSYSEQLLLKLLVWIC